jgi:excisionase family DNA binding protein
MTRSRTKIYTRLPRYIEGLVARHLDDVRVLYEIDDPPPQGDVTVGRHFFRPAPPPEVLTLEEVADLLQVKPGDVRRLAERGNLPGRRIGRTWRFSHSAVLAWLAGDQAES